MNVGPKALERRYEAAVKRLVELTGARTRRFTPEGIHDMRIAARRLQVIMKLLPKRVQKSSDFVRYERAIRNLLEATSGIRDADTVGRTVESLRNILLPDFFAELAGKRKSEGRKAGTAMSELLRLAPPAFERSLVNQRKLSARITKQLKKRKRTIKSVLRKVLEDESRVKELHALRIEVKKARYLTEFIKKRAPKKSLADWQDTLGRVHDIDVAIAYLKSRPVDYSEVVNRLSRDRHLAYLRFTGQFVADSSPGGKAARAQEGKLAKSV